MVWKIGRAADVAGSSSGLNRVVVRLIFASAAKSSGINETKINEIRAFA